MERMKIFLPDTTLAWYSYEHQASGPYSIHFSQTDLPVRGVLPANDSVRHIQDVVSFNHGVKFSWVDDEFGRYSFFVGRTEEKMGLFG